MSGVPAMVVGRQVWAAGGELQGKETGWHGVCSLEKGNLHFGPLIYDYFNCILNWFKICNFMQLCPWPNFNITLDFERLFHFGPSFLIYAIWPLIDN